MTSARPAGRPRRSSRATLEEAAAEPLPRAHLRGHHRGADRPARRGQPRHVLQLLRLQGRPPLGGPRRHAAGGGRGGLRRGDLRRARRRRGRGDRRSRPGARRGLAPARAHPARGHGPRRGRRGEGVARAAPLVDPVAQALARGAGRRASDGPVRVAASVVAAATAAAVMAWAADGVGRGPLEDAVRRALDPLRPALQAALVAG
ncbi:TetR family transcriptional regulator [Clavibacter tessellarius]